MENWESTCSFLEIKRKIQSEDLISKKTLVYFSIILGLYFLHLFIGWKVGWDMFSLKEFVESIFSLAMMFTVFLFFFRLNTEREKFLTGIKIYGMPTLEYYLDATTVENEQTADYIIITEEEGQRLKYTVKKRLGSMIEPIFNISAKNLGRGDVVMHIAIVIYTSEQNK